MNKHNNKISENKTEAKSDDSRSVGSSSGKSLNPIEKKQTFDFKISGVPYKIKTSHDSEMVQELIRFVSQKVDDAMKNTKNGSFQNAAVLAALNIAEELILLKHRARTELEKLEEKTLRLSLELDQSKTKKETEKVSKISWN